MFCLPPATPYDLRFFWSGYPVRIHPLFWIVMACLGWGGPNYGYTLMFIACAFFSILLHEYGHGWTARWRGCSPVEIVLFFMGGLCAYHPNRFLERWEKIVITAAGPLMNLLIGSIVTGLFWALPAETLYDMPNLYRVLFVLWWINIVWGILNLLPIYPLDGGQILKNLLPPRYELSAHYVSIGFAVALGFYLSSGDRNPVSALFGWLLPLLLIYENIQIIMGSTYRGGFGGRGSGGRDPADWWK